MSYILKFSNKLLQLKLHSMYNELNVLLLIMYYTIDIPMLNGYSLVYKYSGINKCRTVYS